MEVGANPNAKDADGITALMTAARGRLFETRNSFGWTYGYTNSPEIVRLLLEAGADINARDNDGNSALIWAVIGQSYYDGFSLITRYNHSPETVRLLLEAGADINNDGPSALIIAASRGYRGTVRILLEAGVDVNASDSHGNTALMMAANQANIEVLRLLLEAGADANASNSAGRTALEFAVDLNAEGKKFIALDNIEEPLLELVQLLLDAGADPGNVFVSFDFPNVRRLIEEAKENG